MPTPRNIRCTFLVAAANRALFTDDRAAMPEPGEHVSYEGHDYEVITATEQLPPDRDPTSGEAPVCALVRVQPIDASPVCVGSS